MEFIHDRKSNILFSLYGSKVNRIKIHNKTLTLTVEEMYQLLDGEEKAFSGEICFNNCDVDVNDTLRMYKNDDIRMYNFNCITDTIVEVITTCNTYTLLTVHLL